MTLSHATIKTAIKTWVEAQSGLVFQWRDEAGGWHSKATGRILGHLKDVGGKGVDYLQWAQDTDLEAGVDFVPTVQGNRALVLSLECNTRNQTGDNTAPYFLGKVRTSKIKPTTRATLYAAGLIISDMGTVLDISKVLDNRVESVAQLDVFLSSVVNERDEAEAQSFVEKATITGSLETPAGEDVGWEDVEFPEE